MDAAKPFDLQEIDWWIYEPLESAHRIAQPAESGEWTCQPMTSADWDQIAVPAQYADTDGVLNVGVLEGLTIPLPCPCTVKELLSAVHECVMADATQEDVKLLREDDEEWREHKSDVKHFILEGNAPTRFALHWINCPCGTCLGSVPALQTLYGDDRRHPLMCSGYVRFEGLSFGDAGEAWLDLGS